MLVTWRLSLLQSARKAEENKDTLIKIRLRGRKDYMVGLYKSTPTERLSNEEENGRGTRLSRQAFGVKGQ